MERSGGFMSCLVHGDNRVGEVVIYPQNADPSYLQYLFGKEIRVSGMSSSSERCMPLTVLHTIASNGPWFKLVHSEQQNIADVFHLGQLHTACLEEAKTAVVRMEEGNELHLVAMLTRGERERPCFWAFVINQGLYASCLAMLNLRCLAIVFDLDETLIVANTMRSFEDRIDALDRKIRSMEVDPQRRAIFASEMKRYQEDKNILKQYVENDQVFDNGKLLKAQSEMVAPVTDGALPIVRPVIRLQDRNMILTRINPLVRDTSVLVRLRPAWEELRGYLTAKGRKRFEVYICTMSERDYALEMWRLLDPDARLINTRELMDRLLCVKSGSKKALANVFPHHQCHPKMAMVVDDRLKVWEDSDQPRVYVVPAFAPYYAPQAETNSALPALCVTRNVACNVRAGFFKQFDESLSAEMVEVNFDTDVGTLPRAPDVSNYLVAEQDTMFPMYGIANEPKEFMDGMVNSEVDNRLEQAGNNINHSRNFPGDSEDLRLSNNHHPQIGQQTLGHLLQANHVPKPLNMEPRQDEVEKFNLPGDLQHFSQSPLLRPVGMVHTNPIQGSSPAREEGEVPESELDPDTRRRLLILQHGQDTNHGRESLIDDGPYTMKLQGMMASGPSPGGWLGGEEEMSPMRPNRSTPELLLEPESPSFDSQWLQGPPGFQPSMDGFYDRGGSRDPLRRLQAEEMFHLDDRQGVDGLLLDHSSVSDDEDQSLGRGLAGFADMHGAKLNATNFVSVLQGIGQRCKAMVEYRSLLTPSSHELLFTVEVLFAGQKVGQGTGRTKKEARHRAAEDALRFLARQFPTQGVQGSHGLGMRGGGHPFHVAAEEDSIAVARRNTRDPRILAGLISGGLDMDLAVPSTSGQTNYGDFLRAREDPMSRPFNFVSTLKERCTVLGVNVNFQDLPTTGLALRRLFHCQVEVGGQVLGKGSGLSWDIAKQHAAEEALRNIKPGQNQKRVNTPRSPPLPASKRIKIGLPSSPGRGRRRPPIA